MTPLTPKSNAQSMPLVIAFSLSISIAIGIIGLTRGLDVVGEGPGLQSVRSAESLWARGSLEAPEYREIHAQLLEKSFLDSNTYWQDAYAISSGGLLLPKHSLLFAVVIAPFVGLMGTAGLWIFNQLVFLTIVLSFYHIACSICERDVVLPAMLTLLLGTQTALYAFALSYDLFGCALIISGFALAKKAPVWGGLIMALSVFVRPTNLILLPFIIFAWPKHSKSDRVDMCLGCVSILLAFLVCNWITYGSPLITAYQSLPAYRSGQVIQYSHPIGLDLQVFLSDWDKKLLGSKTGLLRYNPVLALLPFALIQTSKSVLRFSLTLLAAGIASCIYVFSYEMWSLTNYGSRFLMPTVLLMVLAGMPALKKISR